jgi:hypothetical protein
MDMSHTTEPVKDTSQAASTDWQSVQEVVRIELLKKMSDPKWASSVISSNKESLATIWSDKGRSAYDEAVKTGRRLQPRRFKVSHRPASSSGAETYYANWEFGNLRASVSSNPGGTDDVSAWLIKGGYDHHAKQRPWNKKGHRSVQTRVPSSIAETMKPSRGE